MKFNLTLFFTTFFVTIFIFLTVGYIYCVRPTQELHNNLATESIVQNEINSEQSTYSFKEDNSNDKEENVFLSCDNITSTLNDYGLELPINGATGYTSINLSLYKNLSKEETVTTLEAGTSFRILQEDEDMWYVKVNNLYGYLEYKYCMINLPDVIPSIIYYDSNSVHSLFKSVGKDIVGITNEQLYDSVSYNCRFGEDQFVMPVLYSMSKKIALAQQTALKDGNCLKIYQAYRPYETQQAVSSALSYLISTDSEVKSMIECAPWNIRWFISTSVSNHQKGIAIDVSLVKVTSAKKNFCGNYPYIKVIEYEDYEMPTPMHELSKLACTFKVAVRSNSKTAWKDAQLSSSMTESAIKLQSYCTENELYPLASEWWHFNDLDALEEVGENYGKGNYYLSPSVSTIPE